MTCRSCGATIAEKAIVCYRCGTPTALPAELSARATARRPPIRPPWLVLPLIAAIIALAVWLIPRAEPGGSIRWILWAAVAAVVLAVVRVALRRR